ncbi:hypothetical protein DRQ50_07130 [bacterium]|nr:MAG: hypothetical protein DRQ50_07130 [bacterium]
MSSAQRSTLSVLLLVLLVGSGCTSEKIVFVYPDEELDFRMRNLGVPALYLDQVTDMRPPEQREGEGRYFKITYPKDSDWEVPATRIYAEALAQDVDQTHLFELVPLRGQADYALSMDLLSMSCELRRSPASMLLSGGLGVGLGMVLGDDASSRAKYAVALGIVGILAIPVPTKNYAECEVRLTLENAHGDVVWQESCLGEHRGDRFMSATAREDQKLVNEHLTKAVKRANACLLGQLRHYLLETAGGGG